MTRRNITSEYGEFLGWFDDSCCKAIFNENTYFDGHNRISKATGSQWISETLYLTAKGVWIIENARHCRTTFRQITATEAARWIMQNDLDDDPKIPSDVIEIMDSHEM